MFCFVNDYVCLVCCVFDSVCELLGETIRNMLGVVVILLWNVLKVFSVDEDALLDILRMVFQWMCVLCV